MIYLSFKLIGALGIFLIAIGIIMKHRQRQDIFYIWGGICLEAYSIYIYDMIFIILQFIFIFVAIYDFAKIQYKNKL